MSNGTVLAFKTQDATLFLCVKLYRHVNKECDVNKKYQGFIQPPDPPNARLPPKPGETTHPKPTPSPPIQHNDKNQEDFGENW